MHSKLSTQAHLPPPCPYRCAASMPLKLLGQHLTPEELRQSACTELLTHLWCSDRK